MKIVSFFFFFLPPFFFFFFFFCSLRLKQTNQKVLVNFLFLLEKFYYLHLF